MLGRETHFRFETQERADGTLAQVLKGCSRPIVVVPPEMSSGNGVIVAYGGGREVGQALQIFQFLGLSAGETIHVLSVHRGDLNLAAYGELACDFLNAHGAPNQLHDIQSNAEPAAVLLEQIEVLRPRLVVMGSHTHRLLRDLFSTSVTTAVLRASPVPVLIGG
jgi:nucleotide-binding universal stress UspA family protein